MAKEENKEVKDVKIDDLVMCEGTEKAKYIQTGRKVKLHKVQAERLEKMGYVKIVK